MNYKRIDKFDFLKIVNFCLLKDTIKRLKVQPTKLEGMFAYLISLVSRIYKFLQPTAKRPFLKKGLHFCIHVDNSSMKRCSALIIWEMLVKSTINYHFTSTRMAIINKMENSKCWQRM